MQGLPEADLAGALHEVSNALTVVLGWLAAARVQLPEGAARDALDVARSHAQRGHLVARRAIGAEVQAEDGQRGVGSLARDAVLGVTQEAERRAVRVILELAAADDALVQDAHAALQILLNLLLNALAFTPPAGAVTLSARVDGTTALFLVSDEGPGIDPARIDSIFAGPDSTRRGGAGVGLRHSSALAESKGGDLSLVEGAAGATFELRWPISEVRSSARHRPPASVLDGRCLIVLEDDPAVQSLLELGLGARGARVTGAADADALERAVTSTDHVDALLLDLSPLGTDVDQRLARVRSLLPHTPILVISGSASPSASLSQVAGWVRKPFEVDEVVEALCRLFAE